MPQPTDSEVDQRVLEILRDARGELSSGELVQRAVTTSGLREVDVKRSIWRLISGQLIQMSAEQLLSIASERDHAA